MTWLPDHRADHAPYCSDHCAESARAAAAPAEGECHCGHAGCASEASGTALG
jgi:hypothetical protein